LQLLSTHADDAAPKPDLGERTGPQRPTITFETVTFSGGQTTSHFDQLSEKCSRLGLWLVPVGELEGFCRSLEARHGPAFVEKVLRERDLESDEELREARAFMKKIWEAP
jgi:hypothetical protein